MPAITKEQVKEGARQLAQDIEVMVDTLPPSRIEAIDAVLHRTRTAIEKLQLHGAYKVEVSPEQQAAYFPSGRLGSAVTDAEIASADAQWAAARRRGLRFREQALAAIGPVLTPGEVAYRLGVSKVTVNNWRKKRRLLGIRFDGHQYLYPAFQFATSPAEGAQGVLRHFGEVLAPLDDLPPWEQAQFFVTKSPALGGKSPVEILRRGLPAGVAALRDLADHAGELGA